MTNSSDLPAQKELNRHNIVAFLQGVFERRGDEEYLGEPVTMSAHMLQCAQFAENNQDDADVVVAALLHDIGHFTSEFGSFSMQDTEDRYHEEAGATLLKPWFPELVIDCIRFHVPAKRYLCLIDPAYHDALSDASIHSLKLQGGPMNREEAAQFERHTHVDAIVKIRRYDDRAKIPNHPVPEFQHYVPLVQQVADSVL